MDFVRPLKASSERSIAWVKNLKSRTPRQLLSLAMLLVGVLLISYVGSQYWAMYHSQRQLEAQWEHQQQLAPVATPGQPKVQPAADDLLTKVSIPKIKLDAIVVEGASRKQLSIGPGHVIRTAMPGEPGNAVITGHRDTFFRHIYELQKGDEIQVRRSGQVFTFQVTGKKIVKPEDVSVLKQTTDARLTLITCYPTYYIGPAPERLVVFSKLVDGSVQNQQADKSEKKEQAAAAQ
jgi:sortase A